MTQENEPSWKRFENHAGPDEDMRTRALRAMRIEQGHGSGGGDLSSGTPRKTKFGRATKINGVPLR